MRGYKRFLCMLLTLSFVVSAFAGCGSSDVEKKESDDEILKIFSYDLFKQVSNEKNPIVSPVSAYLALAMAGAGADALLRRNLTAFSERTF
ncbi:MAG: hypothetical protein J6Z02_02970 [Lachnospiraceae bacterium]|nr:hypothetical protein [Lachnospiraceae bacterium]